jgi:hypothetical protein
MPLNMKHFCGLQCFVTHNQKYITTIRYLLSKKIYIIVDCRCWYSTTKFYSLQEKSYGHHSAWFYGHFLSYGRLFLDPTFVVFYLTTAYVQKDIKLLCAHTGGCWFLDGLDMLVLSLCVCGMFFVPASWVVILEDPQQSYPAYPCASTVFTVMHGLPQDWMEFSCCTSYSSSLRLWLLCEYHYRTMSESKVPGRTYCRRLEEAVPWWVFPWNMKLDANPLKHNGNCCMQTDSCVNHQ